MNTSLRLLCCLGIAFLVHPSHANDKSTSAETVGFGGGAVIGASLGGPVGAIVGASLGAFLGDSKSEFKQMKSELNDAQTVQRKSQQDVLEHQNNLQQIQRELVLAEHEIEALHGQMQELFIDRALIKGLEFSVYFDTDQAELENSDLPKLVTLAKLLAEVPGLAVELSGFADTRGDDDYNQTLSLDRAFAVADTLVALGVDQEQLRTRAFGETRAFESQIEDLQKDRRVNLKIDLVESRFSEVVTDPIDMPLESELSVAGSSY